jgi:hypothetical protein
LVEGMIVSLIRQLDQDKCVTDTSMIPTVESDGTELARNSLETKTTEATLYRRN